MSDEWISVKDKIPEIGISVLIFNEEGIEVAALVDEKTDGVDEMGHDSGWAGTFAIPGRSFGNPSYQWKGQGEATHWMPLPEPPSKV